MQQEKEITKKLDKLIDDVSIIKTDVAVMKVENTNHLKHHEATNLLCLERHNYIDKSLAGMRKTEEYSTAEIKSDIKDNQKTWLDSGFKIATIVLTLVTLGIVIYKL